MFHVILDQFISCQNDDTFYFPLFTLYFLSFTLQFPKLSPIHLCLMVYCVLKVLRLKYSDSLTFGPMSNFPLLDIRGLA